MKKLAIAVTLWLALVSAAVAQKPHDVFPLEHVDRMTGAAVLSLKGLDGSLMLREDDGTQHAFVFETVKPLPTMQLESLAEVEYWHDGMTIVFSAEAVRLDLQMDEGSRLHRPVRDGEVTQSVDSLALRSLVYESSDRAFQTMGPYRPVTQPTPTPGGGSCASSCSIGCLHGNCGASCPSGYCAMCTCEEGYPVCSCWIAR
jgi:hypothetical protein